MRQQNFHYLKALADKQAKENQKQLDHLELLYCFNCYNEFGYTKEEIENKIKSLKGGK